MRNELVEFKDELPLDVSVEQICECLYTLTNYGKELYSYFVGRKNDIINIKVVYSLSGNNTIDRDNAIDDICVKISDYILTMSNAKCITFGQPPLEMVVELYQPMLKKMVDKLSIQWKQFEYDDLFSIGNYILVKLYRQGYYINKYLVWTSLNNEILVQYRKIKYKPIIVSLDDVIKLDAKIDSEELTYGDIIKDESYEEEEEKQDEKERVFAAVCSFGSNLRNFIPCIEPSEAGLGSKQPGRGTGNDGRTSAGK
jgi:hypothetical protein